MPIAVPRELINVAQVTCLLTIAMIEGQGTPYWFIERLWPDWPQEDKPETLQAFRELDQQKRVIDCLRQEVTPLSRYLLKAYEVLDTCWLDLRYVPLSEGEQAWLLEQMQNLAPHLSQANAAAEREQSLLRIIGSLIELLQAIGRVLTDVLEERIAEATLLELQESMHGIAALYQAIGYASQEQRHVLTSELGMIAPVIAAIEQELRAERAN
jgi:hypothetical protein